MQVAPGRERGLRVFDRVRIWSGENGNVHYEIRDANDVPFVHGAMSESDWKDLRAKQIQTYPPNVSVSLLTNLIAILAIVAEDF